MSFRNPKLLWLAKDCPECMRCRAWNEGQVVACHSNSIRDGKGRGVKAHDIPAYLCQACHDRADGRSNPELTQEARDLEFYYSVYRSMLWLLQEGHLEVSNGI